jgi:hypothetical protein
LDGRTIPKQSTDEKPWKITVKNPESEAEIKQKNKEFNKKLNASIEETELLLNDASAARDAVTAAKKTADEALEQVQEAWLAIVPSLPDIPDAYWSYSDIAYTHWQTKLPTELKTLCEDYQSKKLQAKELQAEADLAVEIAENKTEETLALWRTTNNYKADLNLHSGKISYSYLEANADTDDANNLARSFIYVKISVLVDSPDKEVKEKQREFANDLYEKVIKVVPSYVEANMAVPSDYEGTNCQRITRTDEIHLTNPLYTTNQAIKYAVLFAVAAAVIAAVLIIIVDRSDKRLRDQETITRLFNVPVLGIVPTIDDLTELSAVKKKERAKRETVEKKEKSKAEKAAKTESAKAEKEAKAEAARAEKEAKVEAEKAAKAEAEAEKAAKAEAARAEKEAKVEAEKAAKAEAEAEKAAKAEAARAEKEAKVEAEKAAKAEAEAEKAARAEAIKAEKAAKAEAAKAKKAEIAKAKTAAKAEVAKAKNAAKAEVAKAKKATKIDKKAEQNAPSAEITEEAATANAPKNTAEKKQPQAPVKKQANNNGNKKKKKGNRR